MKPPSNQVAQTTCLLAIICLLIPFTTLEVNGQSSCVTPPAGLVSWWQAESNATDFVGHNNGTIFGGVSFASGMVGGGFKFDGTGYIVISNSPSLTLTNQLTIELWYLTTQSNNVYYTLIDKRVGGSVANYGINNAPNNGLGIFYDDPTVQDGDDTALGSAFEVSRYAPAPSPGVFHHLAATYEQLTNNTVQIQTYVDGQIVKTKIIQGNLANTANSSPVTIGAGVQGLGEFFVGIVDEVSIYNRVLTSAEVQAIYTAGGLGKCSASAPPFFLSEPSDQTVHSGETVTFAALAGGSQPLIYQWSKNGTALAGATSNVLSLLNLRPIDSGIYSVTVSNSAGSLASSNALLTVQPVCAPPPSGIVSWWRAESTAQDFVGTNSGSLMGGSGFAVGEVGSGFNFNGNGQFFQVPDSASLRFTNEVTVELWYKDTGSPVGGYYGLLAKRAAYPAGCNYGIDMFVGTSGLLQVYVQDPNYGGYLASTSPLPTPGVFHHVAATYKQIASEQVELRTYIDGQLVHAETVTANLARTLNDAPVTIGADDPNETYFVGVIDEPSIYGRALSAAEIMALYDSGPLGKCSAASLPRIVTQPVSQTAHVGDSVDLTVVADGTGPLSFQWEKDGVSISGATTNIFHIASAQLNDAADYSVLVSNIVGEVLSSNASLTITGPQTCVPAPSGLVSWWQGDGTPDDFVGVNSGTLKGATSFSSAEVGRGFSFDGAGSFVQVPDSPSLRFTNSLTVELWYKDTGATAGHFYGFLSKRAPYPSGCNFGLDMFVSTQALVQVYIRDPHYGGYLASTCPLPPAGAFHHLAATYRQASAEQVELKTYIDGQLAQTGTVPGNLARTVNNAPVTIGADDPNETYFIGVIDEPTIYDRALSPEEIQLIYSSGTAGKCRVPFPPTIISQPADQTVQVGGTASLLAVAGGSTPLSYQWRFKGTEISGATTNFLQLSSVATSDSGIYDLVVTNVAGSVTSNPVLLTVSLPPASVRIGSTSIAADGTVQIPVNFLANGNENSLSFSINFDPAFLTNPVVALGSGASGASLFPNLSQAGAGRIGMVIGLPAGATFAAGTQQVLVVTCQSAIVTAQTTTTISFGNSPVASLVVDAAGHPVSAVFSSGSVVLPPSELEADSFPRPDGDGKITVSDWVQVGRYVAQLDFPTNGTEFQKADCAPRGSLGDGAITVSDWVQAGRYVAGLDPVNRLGGPSSPLPSVVSSTAPSSPRPKTDSTGRQLKVLAPVLNPGQDGIVSIELESAGGENALSFSLSFDSSKVEFLNGSAVATSTDGSILNFNTRLVSQGQLGCVLALNPGQSMPAGTKQLIHISFRALPQASGGVGISFSDSPVPRGLSDSTAHPLQADYRGAQVSLSTTPTLSINLHGGALTLSWPGSAVGFQLQESTDATFAVKNWKTVTATPSVTGSQSVLTLPASSASKFYRLCHP